MIMNSKDRSPTSKQISEREEMVAMSMKQYATRLREELKLSGSKFELKDLDSCKELIRNIQFQEDSQQI